VTGLEFEIAQLLGVQAFRKRIYGSIAELQEDLDEWIRSYNENRPHQGRWCFGKTPMQTSSVYVRDHLAHALRVAP
jgi:hypothetical protein